MVFSACEISSKKKNRFPQFEERVGKDVAELIVRSSDIKISRTFKTQGRFVAGAAQKALSVDEIKRLQGLLLNDEGYVFDKMKKCLFMPEIALKFYGEKELIIYVSSICKQIKIDDLKQTIVLDYDPMAEELTPFVKSLLGESHE